jgi:hypothetical protein
MTINKIQIIILILSIIDITATHFYVSTFHAKFPQLDYTTLEANPILRFSWKTFGLKLGSIIGGVIVFSILAMIVYNMNNNWQYFFLGLLTMMVIYHSLNFTQLAALKPVGA